MTTSPLHSIMQDCKTSCFNPELFSPLAGKTILVTGGTGFMGKWIAETVSYLNQSASLGIKLYLMARNPESFRNSVPHLAKNKNIHLMEQDIRNLHDVPAEIQYVVHAAGSPDSREHVSQPLRTIETIYKGTNAVLDICFRLPDLVKLVHISSHQVYGVGKAGQPLSEKYMGNVECNSLNAAYVEGKRISETLCSIYRNQQQLPITIVRPFAFIGPYQKLDKPWAVNNFIRDAILNQSIRILGNENTVRSYLYGSDMACWLLTILAGGRDGETYNLGSSNGISLQQLAEKVALFSENKISIIKKSSRENYDEASVLYPDLSKLMAHCKVKETIDIDTAIKRTLQWNRNNGYSNGA